MAISQGYQQLGRGRRLLKRRESLVSSFQILVDVLLTMGLLLVLIYYKVGEVTPNYRALIVVAMLLQFVLYGAYGVYRQSGSLTKGCYRLVSAWFVFLLLLLFVGFLTKASEYFSREVFVLWGVLGLLLQLSVYSILYRAIGAYRERFEENLECLIVGHGRLGHHLKDSINNNKWLPDRVVGFVSSRDYQCYEQDAINPVPILGDLGDIERIIIEYDIKRVYIAVPLDLSEKIEHLHVDLLNYNVDLIWVPDIYALQLLNHSVREVGGLPLIFLNESPMTSTRTGILFKDIMDRSVAVLLLVILSPYLLLVALGIKITSKGPVFFKQERHGWDGSVFKIWKFRSMYVHDEGAEVTQASRGDKRVTPIGRHLRRTSVDELPQLFNVLFGDMSLVGPRPHAVAHNEFYDDHIDAYLARHRIKPGITGLAQINGCRGETEELSMMLERVQYDVEYINNWSFWLDIQILIKTPLTLLSKDIY